MHTLNIFYDGTCGLCGRFRNWLEAQPSHLELRFLAYQSAAAHRALPEIDLLDPGKELVVLDDEGGIYQGPDAWILCLWATVEYRPWSGRLANPVLRPMVKGICHAVSENRYNLSRLLGSPGQYAAPSTVPRSQSGSEMERTSGL